MTVGDPVLKTGSPLAVQLGPGLLSQIFDGIQRPLNVISQKSNSVYVPRGVDVPSLDEKREWLFTPEKLKKGQLLSGGDVIGSVYENDLFVSHKILLPPNAKGRLVGVEPQGNYNVNEKVITIDDNGSMKEYKMSHYWPVREARPAAEKHPGTHP